MPSRFLSGPSTYTPLFRRFANERDRELRQARELYSVVKRMQDAFGEDKSTIGGRVFPCYFELPEPLADAFSYALYDILAEEPWLAELPEPDLERMSLEQFVEYRNLLLAKEYLFKNQKAMVGLVVEGLTTAFTEIIDELPEVESPSPFTIPLAYALAQPGHVIREMYGTFANYYDYGLFRPFLDRIHANVCEVSGHTASNDKPLIQASESKLPLDQLVPAYLKNTTWEAFFSTPVPLKLTNEDRYSHMHVIGGSGAGKTTLIENLVLHDIQSDRPPSLVIVDPHSDLIRKLTRTDLGVRDRLVIIDPRDIDYPPALNIFALNQERMKHYDAVTQEQVTAGVIQTFDYLFAGLIGADLTAKQGVFFRYIARLMLSLPTSLGRNATIIDMLKLMSDDTPYKGAIERLPPIQREFFERDFNSKTFVQTKEQIRYRLQAILENPTLARLFTAPETKIDLFTELNKGSIILVDTAKDFLKDGSSTFGRLFISLVMQAILERAAIPERHRKPTFLIVDEAGSYFDSNIDDLLTEARKYKCGLVLAHQFLDQATHSLRASLAANTGIKFASGLSAGDARAMASEMRTTPDFILDQPRLQFACHIRGTTPHAVSIPVKPGVFDEFDRLDEEEFEDLIAANRERVAIPRAAVSPMPQAWKVGEPPRPDEDVTREW